MISRTVGIDRIVDEFIFCFTHDEKVDWLYFSLTPSLVHRLALTFGYSIPGIPPTGKAVRLPMVSVVNVRGDRLYHEHIWWDQACCLRQLGLLPEYLPFPYRLPDGRVPQDGKRFEYRVPVAGEESAAKLVDQHSAESNEMFDFGLREI